MFGTAKGTFDVADETLSQNDFARVTERMYRHPDSKAYFFTQAQYYSGIIRDAADKGVITLGPRERHWYKTRRGGFIRIGPDDNPNVRLASVGMYTRRRIFLTDKERNRRDSQREKPRSPIINAITKYRLHYHKQQHWYYLLGLALTIIGITISFH